MEEDHALSCDHAFIFLVVINMSDNGEYSTKLKQLNILAS